MTEKSLFIVKPDAVARNLVGEVISRFEKKNFKIVKLKMFTFTKEQAQEFYSVHKDKPFFGELVSFKKSDMLKFRNFGKKSLTELEELIDEKGLHFGFDIAKYNLDNE